MYYVNKIALGIFNPVTFGVAVFIISLLFLLIGLRLLKHNEGDKSKKLFVISIFALAFCFGWFYFWSTGMCQRTMGKICGLYEYGLVEIEGLPQCDAIVELGGGMGGDTNISKYACLTPAASRPWHAARLWKARKAPFVITSGLGTRDTDGQLLIDLGVPDSALIYENASRNTEENACFTQRLIRDKLALTNARVLLVTSASHMKRAMMIFRKCAPNLTCIPVVTDYGSVNWFGPLSLKLFIPSVHDFLGNLVVWKECLGVLGYKLRGF